MKAVAVALGCKVDICKRTRVRTSGTERVDGKSKADFGGSSEWGGDRLTGALAVVCRWSCCSDEGQRPVLQAARRPSLADAGAGEEHVDVQFRWNK